MQAACENVCLYLYNLTVIYSHDNTTVLERSVYGFQDFITVQYALQLNTEFTAMVDRRVTSNNMSNIFLFNFSESKMH